MPRRRFDWGQAYLLTDRKELAFENEPAICVGKHDSDMKRPTICAVCGETLGAKDYYCFHMMGPAGRGYDMMIGGGCVRDRIKAVELDVESEYSPKETLNRIIADFPKSGRWYGTFLHHCIAKPYVRNKANAEKWDGSVLEMPGVRFIMGVIDNLRSEGWNLDAEMHLDCGNVDLLATHPERGTVVFDWKSDLCFANKEEYVRQINGYMAELHADGHRRISGYILWVRDGRKEYVPFTETEEATREIVTRTYVPSPRIKCTLGIYMDGGEDIGKKKMIEYTHHRRYGNEVFFYIPPFEPHRRGYEFVSFEASPYREGEHPQWFNSGDCEEGLRLTFMCTKKRHNFYLKAEWKRIRPFRCLLWVRMKNGQFLQIDGGSVLGEDGRDYAEFDTAEINRCLPNGTAAVRAVLVNRGEDTVETSWKSEELTDGNKIRIPCIDDETTFMIELETVRTDAERKEQITEKKPDVRSAGPPKDSWESYYESLKENLLPVSNSERSPVEEVRTPSFDTESPIAPSYVSEWDSAEHTFTPGRIYKSGSKYYGIYKRRASDRSNARAMVDVSEVDSSGRKISDLEWRHVYTTRGGKEYFYGLSDRSWKIYTRYVLSDIEPEGMKRFGEY